MTTAVLSTSLDQQLAGHIQGKGSPDQSDAAASVYQQGGYRKEGEAVEVFFCIVVDRLGDVDVVRQNFSCSLNLEVLWRATEEDHRNFQADPLNYVPSFVPDIHFANGNLEHEQIRESNGHKFVVFQPGEPNIRGRVFDDASMRCAYLNQCIYDISGSFSEPFELENFPMDVQDLQIIMRLVGQSDVNFFAPKCLENSLAVCLPVEQWGIADYAVHEPILESWMQDYGNGLSHATLRMKFARKWKIYFWRIGIFSLILSLCCLLVFTLDKEDVSDRYETLLTLMLAAVAFQYIINSELPKLPYLTLMDVYELFCFSFVFLVLVLVSVSGYFEVEETTDHAFGYAAALSFTLFHIGFGIKAYKARKWEMKKLTMNRWDYVKDGYMEKETEPMMLWPKQTHMDAEHREILLKRSWWTGEEDWAKVKHDVPNNEE